MLVILQVFGIMLPSSMPKLSERVIRPIEKSRSVLSKKIQLNLLGYRIFRENGDKSDPEGRKFLGWSARYDETLVATNPRLAK